MAALTGEAAAEACTLAAVATEVEASMAAGMVAVFMGDLTVVIPVADPTPVLTALPAAPSPVTPGLGKAATLALPPRDGIRLHPVIPATWLAPEPQLPPPGPCPTPGPASLELQPYITPQ
jgi:hypothetical protein